MSRFQERYRDEIAPKLANELGRPNALSLPRLEKIVISMGVGSAIGDSKVLEAVTNDLAQISGQKPSIRKARRSISQFKLREGMPIGCMTTLRGQLMYEFLDRLISLVLPRVRDFRGLSATAFDGHGNYSLGLSEQLVFPEINPDKVKYVQGMNIAIVTTTNSDDESRLLLREFGMPFKRDKAA